MTITCLSLGLVVDEVLGWSQLLGRLKLKSTAFAVHAVQSSTSKYRRPDSRMWKGVLTKYSDIQLGRVEPGDHKSLLRFDIESNFY